MRTGRVTALFLIRQQLVFKDMTTPEAVSITSSFAETMLAAKPAGEKVSCSVLQVDDDFWKVFQFDFLFGVSV